MKKQIIESMAVVIMLFAMAMNTLTISTDTVVVQGSRIADTELTSGHVAGASRVINTLTQNEPVVLPEYDLLTGHIAGASRTVNLVNPEIVSVMENNIIAVAEGEGTINPDGTLSDGTDAADDAASITDGDARLATVDEVKEAVNDSGEDTGAEEAEETVSEEWKDKLMVDVEDYLYVREAPSTDSEVVGKLRKGDVADVIEAVDGWYKITSGNVTGYVSGDYSVTDNAAESLASEVCTTYAVATEGGLRIRSEAGTDYDIVTTMGEGDKATVDTDAESKDGWVAVSFRGLSGYVNADYVDVSVDYGEGITVEEEQAAIEAARRAEEERQSAQVAANTVAPVQNAATAATYDEVTLLAALIQAESGNQPMEGQISVGAVVMNRMRSGAYPNTMYEVIYQRGQFGPAGTGKVASIAAAGPKAVCVQAAQSALAGMDYSGGATHFLPVSSGHAGVVIGGHVFW